jgi:hypothetical protein
MIPVFKITEYSDDDGDVPGLASDDDVAAGNLAATDADDGNDKPGNGRDNGADFGVSRRGRNSDMDDEVPF